MRDFADSEAEANYFAKHLLVPTKFLLQEDLAFEINDDDKLRKLARRYGVSMTLMAGRIAEVRGLRADPDPQPNQGEER